MKKILSYVVAIILLASYMLLNISKSKASSYAYITDLSKLPDVTGSLEDANNRNKTGKVIFNKNYEGYGITVEHPNGTNYILASSSNNPIYLQLPGLDDHDSNLILNSGVLFKGEESQQLIYYELQNPSSSNSDNIVNNIFEDENIIINGFRPYVIWDFESGIFDKTTKLKTVAKHHAGENRRAYVDIVFPIKLDELLMIELEWEYRYKNIFGKWTDYEYDHTVRYKDERVVATNFWNEFKRVLTPFAPILPSTYNISRFSQETITDLGNVTSTYKSNYIKTVNDKLLKENKSILSIEDLFGDEYSVQRVYLNTYSKGLYTDYEIHDDIIILDMMYVYQGEYFHPIIEDIDWLSVGGKNSDNSPVYDFFPNLKGFNDWLKDKFKEAYIIVAVIMVVFTLVLIATFIRWFKKILGV